MSAGSASSACSTMNGTRVVIGVVSGCIQLKRSPAAVFCAPVGTLDVTSIEYGPSGAVGLVNSVGPVTCHSPKASTVAVFLSSNVLLTDEMLIFVPGLKPLP